LAAREKAWLRKTREVLIYFIALGWIVPVLAWPFGYWLVETSNVWGYDDWIATIFFASASFLIIIFWSYLWITSIKRKGATEFFRAWKATIYLHRKPARKKLAKKHSLENKRNSIFAYSNCFYQRNFALDDMYSKHFIAFCGLRGY
jgi:hypothetical protein